MIILAIRPHGNWVKVICACELHVFFHQYVVQLRERRLQNIFRTVSTSDSEQDPEIGGSHVTDMTDSFHGQIRLEKLDTFAAGSQDVRDLWAVRPHAIFVMMWYTLDIRRTDLTLCDLHEFLCLYATDIHEGISKMISGAISTSAVLLDVTVRSSSGVIVSPSDVPVEQLQSLIMGVSGTDTGIGVTPFAVPPSPDIEQQCIQLLDPPACGLPESRQPWLFWKLSAISVKRTVFLRSTESSVHTPPRRLPKSSSSSSIDRFRPLLRESSPPADDCLCPVIDTPDSVGHCEPFPGSEYPIYSPACETVRLVLSAGPSGVSDWVSGRDLCNTAGGIIYLCIDQSLVRPICSMTLLLVGVGDTKAILRATHR